MKKIGLSLISASLIFAFEFQPIGYTAAGMGGAGVASSKGSLALYYNPALLAKHRYTAEFSLGVGVGYREHNLIDRIDKLANDDELEDTIDHIAKNAPISGSNRAEGYDKKMEDALYQLKLLSDGNGASLQPSVAFASQTGPVGFGAFMIGDITAQAIIDKQHLKVIVKDEDNGQYYKYEPQEDAYLPSNELEYNQYSIEYAIDNGLTYINLNGVIITEVPIGYGYSFDYNGFNFSIGGSLKYMQGVTYKNDIKVDTDSDELDDSYDENQVTTDTLGIDLGFLMSYEEFDFGLVAKNLNSPEFDYYDGSKYKVKPMLRAGISYEPTDWLQVAVDADLTENDTLMKDFKSQYVGGGVNIHQSWFSIRAGAKQNIAQSEEGTILTAGLGLGLKWFQFDLAAEVSTKESEYDGDKIPRYARVNVAILSRW